MSLNTSLSKAVSVNALVLGAFAAATALVIALTFQGTKSRIAEQERLAAQRNLQEILPTTFYNNDILADTLYMNAELSAQMGYKKEPAPVHIAKRDGSVTAFVFTAIAPDGYSGDIKMMIGVTIDGVITGVRVLSHLETPGLGDKLDIKKSDWILSFNQRSLLAPTLENWQVKKDGGDFDQFTGATITPRAVVKRVKETLVFLREQRQGFLETKDSVETKYSVEAKDSNDE